MRWEAVRTHGTALFVALHIIAITLVALPSPGGGMNRRTWKEPTVQNEFEAWRGRLAAVGVEMTPEEFEDALWAFAKGLMDGRQSVLAPFRPYYKYMGAWQSWRMFVAPHRYPSRLEIRVQRGGQWEDLYVARSSEATWMGSQLDHDRFRSSIFRYAWPHYRSTYSEFANWVFDRIGEEYPDVDRAETVFYQYETLGPEQVRAGEKPKETRKHKRSRRYVR